MLNIIRGEFLNSRAQADRTALLLETLALHLDPVYGAPYWLERQARAGADWRRQVRGPEDLGKIGTTPLQDLHERPILDFVPRSLHARKNNLVLTESGGRTGEPLTAAFLEDEYRGIFVETFLKAAAATGFPENLDWLLMVPSGPHIIGRAARDCARALGSLGPYSIDFDPRYIRALPEGTMGHRRYCQHLVSQALRILRRQEVGVIFATPPLLALLAEELSGLERARIRGIHWGGMPPQGFDSMRAFTADAFPNALSLGGYGNSLFGVAFEMGEPPEGIHHLYHFLDSRVWAEVTGEDGHPVPKGERGHLRMHRLTRAMMLVNVPEQDTAAAFTGAVHGHTALGDPVPQQAPGIGKKGLY